MMPAPPADRACDVLVVGGGPGAVAAAVAATRRGAGVVLLDEAAPGSRRAAAAGIEVIAGAAAWGAFAPDEVAAVVDGTSIVFRPRVLVLAPRPYSLPLPVPGWALPGVTTLDHALPGGPVVLAGGASVLQAACRILDRGGTVAAVVLTDEAMGLADALRLRLLARGTVPVLRGATVSGCDGAGRFEALLVQARTGTLRVEADACVLHGGWAAETGLARALGARHTVLAPGLLATDVDADGRTSVPGVFAVGGVCAARAAGRVAGEGAARSLGFGGRARGWRPVPDPAPQRAQPGGFGDETIVCPCEGVSAGFIRAALRDGACSLPAVKRATRAGMGRCQARLCGTTLHAFCGTVDEAGHLAPRAPVRPVLVASLMRPEDAHPQPVAAPPGTAWPTVPPGKAPRSCDALVVGGGVVGLCAALYLARAGIDVALVDQAEPGLGASTANAGSLHVQLLPYDFDDGDPGPLGEALALGPRSIALWRALAEDAGEGFGIRTEGGLVLAADAADLAWLGRKAAFERERGVDTAILGASELRALSPALAPGYAGAAFCAEEGQIDPLRGTMALLRLARDAGVRMVGGAGVLGMEAEGPHWRVRTSGGVITAGQVLNAAGAHAGTIAALAGVALPIRAVVQQVIATAAAPPLLRHLVAQARLHLSLKQGDAGHVLVGGGWPGRLGADGTTRLDRRSIQGNLWTAAQVLPGLAELEVVRAWTGLTVHLDRGPVISATPGRPGLFHAVTANGYTLGPVAGRLVADAMLGRGAPPRAFALA